MISPSALQIDFTRDLISWVTQKEYTLIDINLTERLVQTRGDRDRQVSSASSRAHFMLIFVSHRMTS